MAQFLLNINWISILLAAIASMVVGYVWFSDALFGKSWRKMMGVSERDAKKSMDMSMMLWPFIGAVVTAYVLKNFLFFMGAPLLSDAFVGAFMVWLGFFATTLLNGVVFEKKGWDWYWLMAGHHLVSLLAMAAVLQLWP